jgi:hypothetical protein
MFSFDINVFKFFFFVFVIDETSFKLYGSLTELCNDTLCYQETGNLHAKDCIERACDQCGVHLIKFSQYE